VIGIATSGGGFRGSDMVITAGGRGVVLLGRSAIVVGAINAAGHGPHEVMQVGLLGAAAAIDVEFVFCDWPPRPWRRS
jgi:hypothetical protein